MRPPTFRTSSLFLTLILLTITATARAAELPRYNLPPGRMLIYSVHIENTIGDRSSAFDGRWEFTVLRDNPDGSKRIAAIKALSTTSTVGGQSRSSPESLTRGYFDMTPDGKMRMNPCFMPGFNPQIMLPRLPASAEEIEKGWNDVFAPSFVTTSFTMKEPDGMLLVFTGEESGPYHAVNQRHDKWNYKFDPARGLVTEVTGDNGQIYGAAEQKGSAQIVLEKEEQVAPEDLKTLADEHETFVKVFEQAEELTRKAAAGLAPPDETFAKAEEALTEASNAATTDPVKLDFTAALGNVRALSSRRRYTQQRIDPLIGQPAPDLNLTDVQGQSHKLADLQGKVVVLDFFRRNATQAPFTACQVKQVAADLKDKPVAFFGMNNDTEEDRKAMIDALGITYPVLIFEGQPSEFGLPSMLGTVIIDQKGNLRAVLLGYSKTRGIDVKEHVEQLLKSEGEPQRAD